MIGKVVFPEKSPSRFLQDACAVPKDDDIKLAIKSLKLLGALTTRKGKEDERSRFTTFSEK